MMLMWCVNVYYRRMGYGNVIELLGLKGAHRFIDRGVVCATNAFIQSRPGIMIMVSCDAVYEVF